MPDWVLSCSQRVALCVIFMRGGVGEGWFPATGLQDVWSGGAVSSVSSSGLKTDRCLLHAVLRAACFNRFGHLLQALPLFKSVSPQRTTDILLPLNVARFVTARQCNRTQFQGTICDFHHCKKDCIWSSGAICFLEYNITSPRLLCLSISRPFFLSSCLQSWTYSHPLEQLPSRHYNQQEAITSMVGKSSATWENTHANSLKRALNSR